MEAKDKAINLVNKMTGITYQDCINNALTCVGEILKTTLVSPPKTYWQQVKTEIEKL